MSELARAIGAPSTITIDNTSYLCGPITMGDWGALQRHMEKCQPDVLGEAIKKAEKVRDPAIKKLLIDAAVAEHKRSSQTTYLDAVNFGTQTYEGAAFLLWLGIRKHDKDAFTYESMLERAQEMDAKLLNSLLNDVLKAAGMDDPEAEEGNEGNG